MSGAGGAPHQAGIVKKDLRGHISPVSPRRTGRPSGICGEKAAGANLDNPRTMHAPAYALADPGKYGRAAASPEASLRPDAGFRESILLQGEVRLKGPSGAVAGRSASGETPDGPAIPTRSPPFRSRPGPSSTLPGRMRRRRRSGSTAPGPRPRPAPASPSGSPGIPGQGTTDPAPGCGGS